MSKKKYRADELLFKKGLAESRSKAQAFIMTGEVEYFCSKKQAWQVVKKAGEALLEDTEFKVNCLNQKDVGRGAQKLRGAFDIWSELEALAKDTLALDIGSSTGGFTQVMLEKGAAKVVALDVGTNQLHERLRADSRVVSIEQQHVLKVEDSLWSKYSVDLPFNFYCSDLSFISMKNVIPFVAPWLSSGGNWIMLVKPQFELEPAKIAKGGIVREQEYRLEARDKIIQVAKDSGFKIKDVKDCPLAGTTGNVEFLLWVQKL